MNNNFSQLSKDIVKAVELFAEFGQRGASYGAKINNVVDPEGEGVFLARCARKVAKNKGVEYAYEWALEQFTNESYNKMIRRNEYHVTPRQGEILDRLFGLK